MGKKNELDKFYTHPDVAKNLLSLIDINCYDLIIEPSAGNGSFSSLLPNEKTVALDLKPENKDIIEQDWFQYKVPDIYKNVLCIGNPPFGDRNKLSREFVAHAISFQQINTIAFVLPNVFKKHTNQKIFPKEWKLIIQEDLPDNSFLLDGEEYHVPCSFFIWSKIIEGKDLRFKPELYQTHNDFDFTTKEDADFYIMGASPSRVKNICEVQKNNRGYYIKSKIDPEIVKENFRNINWFQLGNSSVNGGVAWFTKPEIIKIYSEN